MFPLTTPTLERIRIENENREIERRAALYASMKRQNLPVSAPIFFRRVAALLRHAPSAEAQQPLRRVNESANCA